MGEKKALEREDTMRILFSDEKMFGLDSIYNSENDRIRGGNVEEATRRDGENGKGSLQKK